MKDYLNEKFDKVYDKVSHLYYSTLDTVKVRLHSKNIVFCSDKVSKINLGSKYKLVDEIKEKDVIKISEAQSSTFSPFLVKFVNVMKEHFSKEDLLFLYKNISTLKVEKKDLIKVKIKMGLYTRVGYYNPKRNKISIGEIELDENMYHELLHMASSYATEDVIYTGFGQFFLQKGQKSKEIGRSLNEGYTEVLNKRYFQNEKYSPKYELYYNYASCVEQIVGKEQMEKLYLNADLSGLIDELSKYKSRDESIKFVRNLDLILFSGINKEQRQKVLYSIVEFLCTSFINKMISEGRDIYDPNTKKEIIDFISEITGKVTYNNTYTIEVSKIEIVNDYIRKLENKKNDEGHLSL